ncbi:MAG: hypothetical protein JJE30_16810 [Desulfuromonadales bacterium]|nr:hypothetical protein [Desulfuromonadales bacterium]
MRSLICTTLIVWIIIAGGIAKSESPESCHKFCESMNKIIWDSYVSATKGSKPAKIKQQMIRNNKKLDKVMITTGVDKGFELFYMSGTQLLKKKSASIAELKTGCYLGCTNPEAFMGLTSQKSEMSEAVIEPQNETISNGRVLITMNKGGYTYVKIEENGEGLWVACPEIKVKVGDMIEFSKSSPLLNFESKSLMMTFDKIVFAPEIRVILIK